MKLNGESDPNSECGRVEWGGGSDSRGQSESAEQSGCLLEDELELHEIQGPFIRLGKKIE